jgi:leucyl aminopeptidase
VPINKEENKPKAIELVVPELVTVYRNKTVIIPVKVMNNWNSSLREIFLNATTNASDVSLKFTEDYFEELYMGETRNTSLLIENYRLGENYEVKISANVSDPKASDSALVLLNSIEQAEEGQDVETKVTFAQDLLNENPECMELNELLSKAREEMESGSRAVASSMVTSVINGCKYLVSISKKQEQQPQSIISRFIRKENLKYLMVFAGLVIVLIITMLSVKKAKGRGARAGPGPESKKTVTKEEEVKPYWP